ncbi:hypothetical protein LINGRAHAP2_LOCUS33578 [Linum grandiflorum]
MLLLCSSSLTLASRLPHAAAAAAAGRTRKVLRVQVLVKVVTSYEQEMRTVPSGPDPLHHNGGTPNKKPRPTSPCNLCMLQFLGHVSVHVHVHVHACSCLLMFITIC